MPYPLTKRNAHEQRLPQMPMRSPLPHASAGVDDDDGCDDAADAAGDGDGQCGNVGIGFCLLQLQRNCKKKE